MQHHVFVDASLILDIAEHRLGEPVLLTIFAHGLQAAFRAFVWIVIGARLQNVRHADELVI